MDNYKKSKSTYQINMICFLLTDLLSDLLWLFIYLVGLVVIYFILLKASPTFRKYCSPVNKKLFGRMVNRSGNPQMNIQEKTSSGRKNDITEKDTVSHSQDKYDSVREILVGYKNKVIELNDAIINLQQQIKHLKFEQQKQAEILESLKRQTEMNVTVKETVRKEITVEQSSVPRVEILYASAPEEGSSFFEDTSLIHRHGIDFYEIRIKPGDIQGTFTVFPQGFERKFMNNFSTYGKSACNVVRGENNLNGFNILASGTCEKSGGKWFIKKKIDIEFL
ncbi:MAG: hypothetical protein LUH10_01730 [Tannerellaceae bacterium]|nr:hypothetical protein [Tannerellaceae bacterium]